MAGIDTIVLVMRNQKIEYRFEFQTIEGEIIETDLEVSYKYSPIVQQTHKSEQQGGEVDVINVFWKPCKDSKKFDIYGIISNEILDNIEDYIFNYHNQI